MVNPHYCNRTFRAHYVPIRRKVTRGSSQTFCVCCHGRHGYSNLVTIPLGDWYRLDRSLCGVQRRWFSHGSSLHVVCYVCVWCCTVVCYVCGIWESHHLTLQYRFKKLCNMHQRLDGHLQNETEQTNHPERFRHPHNVPGVRNSS